MMSSSVEPRGWSVGRWWVAIGCVFVVQVALFQFAQNRPPIMPRNAAVGPVIHMSGPQTSEWVLLEDPTLFALPHAQDFSGAAWLRFAPLEFHPSDWSEPARLFALPVAELGAGFINFIQTNAAPSFPTILVPEPKMTMPAATVSSPLMVPSRLQVEGDLAKRRLVSRFTLPAWTHSDLLTNSAVQVLVDARGNTVSAVLLPPGSGAREADQQALDLARSARFEPVPGAPTGLTVGRMVFLWETLPLETTNSPGAIP